jgi:AcrR family transcriptional regulator
MASIRAEQQAITRDRLLDAAAELFAVHGFNGTSVALIASRAGVTTGAIYSNFSGKNDLFAAVVERHMAGQVNEYRRLYSEGGSAAERMQTGADRWMALVAEQPYYFPLFVEVWRVALAEPDIRRRLRTAYRKLLREVARLVSEGSGDVVDELDEQTAEWFALIVCSLADGLAMHKILDPARVPDDLFGGFLRMLVEGVAAGAPSSPADASPA